MSGNGFTRWTCADCRQTVWVAPCPPAGFWTLVCHGLDVPHEWRRLLNWWGLA